MGRRTANTLLLCQNYSTLWVFIKNYFIKDLKSIPYGQSQLGALLGAVEFTQLMQVAKSLQLMHEKVQDWHSVVLLDEK
jgi:hypothetical protein